MSTRFLPSSSILEHFRKLPSNNSEERLKAASGIIAETSNSDADDFDKTAQYVLARLTKGLASGTESSRIGFSIAYTEFLRQTLGDGSLKEAGVTLRGAIQQLKEHTTPPGGTSGQEERDFYFGRLFGLKAVIQSGAVFSSVENIKTFWASIVDELFQLAKKKTWLREPCASTICQTILDAHEDDEELAETLLITYESLKQSGLEDSSEGVAIKLVLFKKSLHVDGMKDVLEKEQFPLEKRYMPTLAKLLKESSKAQGGSSSAAPQKGSWSAKLPFVWDIILQIYLSGGGLKDIAPTVQEVASFQDFWKVGVDESLFAANSSDEKKFWGFQVLGNALKFKDDARVAETVFSQNLMKCFINQLSNSERYLNKVATKAARTIHSVAEKHSSLVPIFVEQLLLHHGSPNFDRLTKTKTVEKLVALADENGLQRLVAIFRNVIEKPGEGDDKQRERTRQWASDQILALVRNKKIEKQDSWLEPIVGLLATFGHFNPADSMISDTSHGMFRSRLLSCLAALIESKESSGSKWACHAVKTISELEKDGKYRFVIEMDAEIQDAKTRAAKTLHKVKKQRKSASKTDRKQLEAFELLYAMVFLQICNGDADAVNVVEELQLCYDKISAGRKKVDYSKHEHRSKRVKRDKSNEEVDVEVSQVLTEVLLSFVSRPSLLLRRLANTVFTAFADAMTESSLSLMFDVLATKETMEGQNALFDEDASEDGGEDDEGMGSDELASDVELVVNGKHQAQEGDEDEDEDEDDDEDDGEDEGDDDVEGMDEEAAMKLDADLADLLRVNRPDGSSMDVDGSDEDESMDDEQMLEMDEKIAEVFRQRSKANVVSKKKMRKEAKENVINFKNRVLELLDIYARHQFADELSLNVMLPCLELIRTTSSKAVAENAHGVLKALVQASKGKGGGGNAKDTEKENEKEKDKHSAKAAELPVPSDPKELLRSLFRAIHDEAGQGKTNQHASACSQCSLHVVRVLVNADDKYLEKVFKLYAESMSRWMRDEKFNPQHTMFSDLVTWAGTVRNQFCSQ